MANIRIPYSKGFREIDLDERNIKGILASRVHEYETAVPLEGIINDAFRHPICSPELKDMAGGAKTVLVITSDHTRPVPSRITLPALLREIRSKNPQAEIRILIATGFHRPDTPEEMQERFGAGIVENEYIINHDCRNRDSMVFKGILPSGGELRLNNLIDWADLVVSEGFIEPHFFAGFSGGRKSILPGIAAEKTVLYNHCAEFIASSASRTGNLNDNPIHRDMVFAAEKAKLAFILNVVIDDKKRVIAAFAGHPAAAHEKGCGFVERLAKVKAVQSDIVITSNGGYPLDRNIYQAVKGMTAARACVREGGVIIMVSACSDGHGGEAFYRWFADADSPAAVAERISCIPKDATVADQWEAQILAGILMKCTVIMVADACSADYIRKMHMLYAESIEKAVETAIGLTSANAGITVIPDGVSVIVE